MTELALHSSVFLIAWWLSTGVVMLLARRAGRARVASLALSTLLAAGGVVGLLALRGSGGAGAAYGVAACVFAVWAWGELTFYTGAVAGPRRQRCPPGCRGLAHFGHALGASLHHELALAATGGLVAWAGAGAAGGLAWKLYLVLWAAHQSARLNVLLGVRNCDERLLPEAVDYLGGFFRRRPMNPLFPVSAVAFGWATWEQVTGAVAAAGTAGAAAEGLLAAALLVALLEHAALMLPVPLDRLWEWAVPSSPPGPSGSPDETSSRADGVNVLRTASR